VQSALEWIAVDWGTSNVRAWGVGADGDIHFMRESPEGMGKLQPGDYLGVLDRLVTDELEGRSATDVLICGMAGARQGWREAKYLEAPTRLDALLSGAVAPEGTQPKYTVRILPGICQRDGEDVMRGEETQLLGLLSMRPSYEGPVIMPGTHSKWVEIIEGRVERFSTAMTGELYEALSTATVLRHSLNGELMGPATEDGVWAGMGAGLDNPELLTSLLFRTRAAALLSGKGPDWCSGYLSGLLVGTEVASHRDWIEGGAIPVIGSARLGRIYSAAFNRIGVGAEPIDAAEATLAGLKAARKTAA
jgi:2-dehydro-3-deoxygalactonokinase